MVSVLTVIGRLMMVLGFLGALGAQVAGFFRIGKRNPAYAGLILLLPGFLLYCMWRSEYRMPGLLRVWLWGAAAFIAGILVVFAASEM